MSAQIVGKIEERGTVRAELWRIVAKTQFDVYVKRKDHWILILAPYVED